MPEPSRDVHAARRRSRTLFTILAAVAALYACLAYEIRDHGADQRRPVQASAR